MLQIYQISSSVINMAELFWVSGETILKKKNNTPAFQKNPYLKDIIKWHIFMSTDVLDW